MLKQDWIAKVKENADVLRDFVDSYHPTNLQSHFDNDVMSPEITAPQAERACEIVREQIRTTSFERPDVQFNVALKNEDTDALSSLLSAVWFGVPESTSCWGIPGFSVAVDLLDDPVEE